MNIDKEKELIDLVRTINRIELNEFVSRVEVIEKDSISVDFVHKQTIEVLSTENACFLPALGFFLEEIVEEVESLTEKMFEFIEEKFESLNFRMALLTNIQTGTPTAYFITVDNDCIIGFSVTLLQDLDD